MRAQKAAERHGHFDTAEDYLQMHFGDETSCPLILNPRIGGDTLLTTIILQRLGVLKEGQSVTSLRENKEWKSKGHRQGNIHGLPTVFDKDVQVSVYQRNDEDQWNSWDIYLKIGGSAGLEMATSPVQESPLLREWEPYLEG